MHLAARLLTRFGRWPYVAAWLLLIFALSSIPNEFAPSESRIPADKVAHIIEYGVLAALLVAAASRGRPTARHLAAAAAAAIVLASLYGVTDELHQRYVPGRDPGIPDWSADVIGSVLGAAAAAIVLRRSVSASSSATSPPRE